MADNTRKTIENQDARDRFWNSLESSYGQQVEKSNEEYNRAYSQAGNQMLSRGMHRSSYGAQVQANLRNQGIKAANDILTQRNNAYANQLYQIERDEVADAQADKQFAANYVNAILSAGGTPSDELLARAGLSRADFNSMKPQQTGGGYYGGSDYSGGGSGKTKTKTGATTTTDMLGKLNSLFGSIRGATPSNKGVLVTSKPSAASNAKTTVAVPVYKRSGTITQK